MKTLMKVIAKLRIEWVRRLYIRWISLQCKILSDRSLVELRNIVKDMVKKRRRRI